MAVHTLTRLTFAAPNAPPVFATDGIGWGRTRKRAPGSQGRLWHTRDTVLVTSNFATHPIRCCSRCKLRADSCQCGTPIPCALFPVACPHPRVCDHLRGQSCSYAVCSEKTSTLRVAGHLAGTHEAGVTLAPRNDRARHDWPGLVLAIPSMLHGGSSHSYDLDWPGG